MRIGIVALMCSVGSLSLSLTGCSDPTGKGSYGEVGAGLTNFSVACRKHDGLESYKKKGNKTYITCKNGKKLTYQHN